MIELFNFYNEQLGTFNFSPGSLKNVNTRVYPNKTHPQWLYYGETNQYYGLREELRGIKVYPTGNVEIGHFESNYPKGYMRLLSLVDPVC
jgi:hypothetical protein